MRENGRGQGEAREQIVTQEREKEERLGRSILDHHGIVRKIWQAWWGILEPKAPDRELLRLPGQGLNSYPCHAGKPGLRANATMDVSR